MRVSVVSMAHNGTVILLQAGILLIYLITNAQIHVAIAHYTRRSCPCNRSHLMAAHVRRYTVLLQGGKTQFHMQFAGKASLRQNVTSHMRAYRTQLIFFAISVLASSGDGRACGSSAFPTSPNTDFASFDISYAQTIAF